MRLLTFTTALAIIASGCAAKAQDAAAGFGNLVTITIAEDRPYTLAHKIIISAEEPVAARTEAQLEGRLWTATRLSERGVETVRSDNCPALQRLALSFSYLPEIPVSPLPSRIHSDAEPLAPTRKDGFSTRLSFTTQMDDGSYGTVEVAGGNAYAEWGHEAVSTLLGCWGPLPS
ncbi:hypothetical protein GVN18_32845 [Pseudomonas sp. ODNR1LW]|nr:hypothetical protein [Pseudomonas sp. ODNR1LW]